MDRPAMTGGALSAVAVEDIMMGQTVTVTPGAAPRVYVAGGADPVAQVRAAAEHARRVRESWNQEDRYPPPAAPVGVLDLLHLAWTVIASKGVHHGGWETQSPEWVQAAIRWRNAYFDLLPHAGPAGPAGEQVTT